MKIFLNAIVLLLLPVVLLPIPGCETKKAAQQSIPHPDTLKVSSTTIPFYLLRNTADLDVLIHEAGDARVVLLGESTHGTSEFYTWRAEISKRLIREKGFDFIAVEGDWGDGELIDRFINGSPLDTLATDALLQQFTRWPAWLWANKETASLVSWLNHYNQQKSNPDKIRFYGLDLFSFWKPITGRLGEIKDIDILNAAKKVKGCFEPFGNDALAYMKAVNQQARAGCEHHVGQLYHTIQRVLSNKSLKSDSDFVLEQEAWLAVSGEKYFRNMTRNRVDTWNTRENYMVETIQRLLAQRPNSKAIIWAHNTHVGDAHYTEIHFSGKTTVGEQLQKQLGNDQVFIVGFSSYSGSFIASEKWGDSPKIMEVPAAVPNSFEAMLHKDAPVDKIVLSKDIKDNPLFKHWVINRAIGVVNNPWQLGTSVGSLIPQRYDAFIFIDHMTAVHPFVTIKDTVGKVR